MNLLAEPIRILHLEDSDLDADLIEANLARAGVFHRAERVWTREDYLDRLDSRIYDLIIADYKLPAFDGLSALEIAREKAPETPFIFVSATLGEEVAIESLKHGATDYIVKSRLNRLASCVERAMEERRQIVARRRAEEAADEAQKRLSAALSVAQIGSFEWRHSRREVVVDERSCAILGLAPANSVSTATLSEMIFEDDREAVARRFLSAQNSRERVDGEFRVRLPNGLVRHVAAVCDWFDVDDDVVGIGVFQDITDRKRAEDDQKLVVRELHHRVKNSLATVQAVITFSLRHARSLDAFKDVIYKRIEALARSHSFLTDDQFGGLLLRDMLVSELGPYNDGERIVLDGPAVYLSTDMAMPFTLAVHELSTNAAKYGALSNGTGKLKIVWTCEANDDARQLELDWREIDGPRIESEPDHKGFGSVLLNRLLGGLPGADVTVDYRPEGLHMHLSIAMPR